MNKYVYVVTDCDSAPLVPGETHITRCNEAGACFVFLVFEYVRMYSYVHELLFGSNFIISNTEQFFVV